MPTQKIILGRGLTGAVKLRPDAHPRHRAQSQLRSRALLAALRLGLTTTMEIHTLEALADNYMYLIVDAATRAGAVVDPADPDVVMEAVQRLGVTLTHVR